MKYVDTTCSIIPSIGGKADLDHGFSVKCKNPSNDCPFQIKEKSIILNGESFKIRGLGERKLWRKFFKVRRRHNENSTILTIEVRNRNTIFVPTFVPTFK
jgi:hypothetical protein